MLAAGKDLHATGKSFPGKASKAKFRFEPRGLVITYLSISILNATKTGSQWLLNLSSSSHQIARRCLAKWFSVDESDQWVCNT